MLAWLNRTRHSLLGPRACVTSPIDRQLSLLLATCIVMLQVGIALGVAVQVFTAPDVHTILPHVIAGETIGLGCIVLARNGRYELGALLFATTLIVACVAGVRVRPTDPIWEGVITLSVVFGSVFLPLSQLGIIAVLAVAGTALSSLTIPELTTRGYAAPLIGYQAVAVAVLLLARAQHDRMQRARRRQEQRMERSLAASRRMETLGRLAGGVAHDFNNFLQVISANTTLLAEGEDDRASQQQMLSEIEAATTRAAALTRQLSTFGRQESTKTRLLDLDQALNSMEPLMRSVCGRAVHLSLTRCDEPLPIQADEGQLGQVLLNLVINARNAMPAGGHVRLSVQRAKLDEQAAREGHAAPGEYAAIQLVDGGTGMSPQTLERAFEPFYTDRPDGSGTGLGLSNAYAIVTSHGGTIRLQSALGEGTTVHVLLPLAGTPVTANQA